MHTYKVWYWRANYAHDMLAGRYRGIVLSDLDKTHIHLKDVIAPSMEGVYRIMQAEAWSPNGEARSLILEKGLTHTSMALGDIIVDENNDAWVVAMFGFDKLGRVTNGV